MIVRSAVSSAAVWSGAQWRLGATRMKLFLAISIVLTTLVSAVPATGQGADPTMEFVWLCEGREPAPNTHAGMAICAGYINGFIDSHVLSFSKPVAVR